jgi:hypothetical protein
MRFCALQGYHGISSTLAVLFPSSGDPALRVQEPLPVAESRDGEAHGVHSPNDLPRAGHSGSEQKPSAYMDLSLLAVPRVCGERKRLAPLITRRMECAARPAHEERGQDAQSFDGIHGPARSR